MIVALCGQKGGAGKSTIAIILAAEWHAQKRKVLLVDADPQGSVRTWGSVAAELGNPAPTVVAMAAGFHRPDQLPALSAPYEHTIIDCPPRLGDLQRSALALADLALLPCGPSTLDAWALAESLELIQQAQQVRPALKAAIVITRKVARTSIGASARKVLADSGLPILKAELGYRVAYQEAMAAGLGVTGYEPSGEASREVRRLVKEVEKYGKG